VFFHAWVFLDGVPVNLELSTDFDERCDHVLAAFLAPSSVLQARDHLAARDRLRGWRAGRG